MKMLKYLSAIILVIFVFAFKEKGSKLVSKNVHIRFYSHTPVEDITANNYIAKEIEVTVEGEYEELES